MPETNAQLSLGSVQSTLGYIVAKSQECEIQVCTLGALKVPHRVDPEVVKSRSRS